MGTAQYAFWKVACPGCGASEEIETADRWSGPQMQSFFTSVEPGTGRVAATCKACEKPVNPDVTIANIHG